MKVMVGNEVKDFRTVWIEGKTVKLIDQPKLPHKFEIYDSLDYKKTAEAIKKMIVRGAPAIGVSAAYGILQACLEAPENDFDNYVRNAADVLRNTRPTAYNLFWAIDKMLKTIEKANSVQEKISLARQEAEKIANDDVETCKKIGEFGNTLIKDGYKILTHCNAGALATVDYGTALAPIRFAHSQGKKIFVFADETRPRCQGSRLTAWELLQENIPHAIIADNAAGYYMQKKEINICIVGADRITGDGSVANKIGTYEKAVLAKENNIPFYVAAPLSTIDINLEFGNNVEIEERNQEEVTDMWGFSEDGLGKIRIAPTGSNARNPAFDVTPAKYISGIITEKGIIKPFNIKELFN